MRISTSETAALLATSVNVSDGQKSRVIVVFVIMANAADMPKSMLYCSVANTIFSQATSFAELTDHGTITGRLSVNLNCLQSASHFAPLAADCEGSHARFWRFLGTIAPQCGAEFL